jgi:hypothetical protein
MDPNPYESPKAPPEPTPPCWYSRFPITDPMTYVLAVLRDNHRQMCQFDAAADRCAFLSFASTVAEWREACDLLPWRELGQAFNQHWGINVPDVEWQATLEPARERRLEDVCALIARNIQRPEIRPTSMLGCTSVSAGAFEAIRSLLQGAGANAKEIAPSTPLAEYTRQYCQLFLGPISRLAPGALPLVRIHTPIQDAAAWGMVCGWLGGWLYVVIGSICHMSLLTLTGVISCVAAFVLPWIASQFTLPTSVEFGKLRTFRDLAVAIADGISIEAGHSPTEGVWKMDKSDPA